MPPKESLIDHWRATGRITDKRLLDAFRAVLREKFVLQEYKERAYDDVALPIIEGQTISQPTTVMIMLQALELKKTDVVLEIGAGSGYNAALLSKLAKKVYTIEFLKPLADFAKKNLASCGIKNVVVIHGDGGTGYPKAAPFDKIIITAACPSVPPQLFEQLKEGGIHVAPLGQTGVQEMFTFKKIKGTISRELLGLFQFVPLRGEYG